MFAYHECLNYIKYRKSLKIFFFCKLIKAALEIKKKKVLLLSLLVEEKNPIGTDLMQAFIYLFIFDTVTVNIPKLAIQNVLFLSLLYWTTQFNWDYPLKY